MEVIFDIKPGEGGTDSKLFAADLVKAYQKYFDRLGYKHLLTGTSILVDGDLSKLILESGKITIQRIPPTESKGRRHTSILNITVMPKLILEFKVNEKDLEIQYTRGSGKGGQNRNKRDTACRITHKPTGLQVFNCEQRYQEQNKERALEILTEKLKERYINDTLSSVKAEIRKQMTDSLGGRSDKSRTYDFIRGYVIDHRSNNRVDIKTVMKGNFDLLQS